MAEPLSVDGLLTGEARRKVELSFHTQYIVAVAISILLYDYVLNLSREVNWIWRAPNRCTFTIILYTLNRYIPILVTPVLIVKYFWRNIDPNRLETCVHLMRFHFYIILLTQGLVAIVLIQRVYALYGKSRWVLAGTGVMVVAIGSLALISVIKAPPTPYRQEDLLLTGTCIMPTSHVTVARYMPPLIIAMLFEVAIFVLILLKAIQHVGSGSRLLELLLRDGLFYFAAIMLAHLGMILSYYIPEDISRGNFATLANWFSATLIARLMLHLRDPSLISNILADQEPTRDITTTIVLTTHPGSFETRTGSLGGVTFDYGDESRKSESRSRFSSWYGSRQDFGPVTSQSTNSQVLRAMPYSLKGDQATRVGVVSAGRGVQNTFPEKVAWHTPDRALNHNVFHCNPEAAPFRLVVPVHEMSSRNSNSEDVDGPPSGESRLPTELWLVIVDTMMIRPRDVIALGQTCCLLHDLIFQRSVWIEGVKKMVEETGIFPPSFPIESMDFQHLQRAAMGPSIGEKLMEKYSIDTRPSSQEAESSIGGLQPASRMEKVLPSGSTLYLVPGGRYAIRSSFDHTMEISLWDLGVPASSPMQPGPILISRFELQSAVTRAGGQVSRLSVSMALEEEETFDVLKVAVLVSLGGDDDYEVHILSVAPERPQPSFRHIAALPSAISPEFLSSAEPLIGFGTAAVVRDTVLVQKDYKVDGTIRSTAVIWNFVEGTVASFYPDADCRCPDDSLQSFSEETIVIKGDKVLYLGAQAEIMAWDIESMPWKSVNLSHSTDRRITIVPTPLRPDANVPLPFAVIDPVSVIPLAPISFHPERRFVSITFDIILLPNGTPANREVRQAEGLRFSLHQNRVMTESVHTSAKVYHNSRDPNEARQADYSLTPVASFTFPPSFFPTPQRTHTTGLPRKRDPGFGFRSSNLIVANAKALERGSEYVVSAYTVHPDPGPADSLKSSTTNSLSGLASNQSLQTDDAPRLYRLRDEALGTTIPKAKVLLTPFYGQEAFSFQFCSASGRAQNQIPANTLDYFWGTS